MGADGPDASSRAIVTGTVKPGMVLHSLSGRNDDDGFALGGLRFSG